MNFKLAFSYVFKEEGWFKKIAIPAVCALIPVIGQFVLVGWAMKAAKNVIDGNEEHALPQLEFGADLKLGFMSFLITFIYTLPFMILAGIASGAVTFSMDADQAIQIVLWIVGGCAGLIGLLIGLLSIFLSMIGVANYIAKGEFGAAFRFKELFGMFKSAFAPWLLVLVTQILAMGIIAPLGAIACGIGALLTGAYGSAVYYHMLGQAYNKSAEPAIGDMETF
jgi:hypothetical protein